MECKDLNFLLDSWLKTHFYIMESVKYLLTSQLLAGIQTILLACLWLLNNFNIKPSFRKISAKECYILSLSEFVA